MSTPTRLTLLARVCGDDQHAWAEFDAVYRPLLRKWLRADPLNEADVEDVVQEVLVFVMHNLPGFDHNLRIGAFRRWLRLSTVNIARNYLRKHARETPYPDPELGSLLAGLEDSDSSVSRAFDLDLRRAFLGCLLNEVAGRFQRQTMDLFRTYVLEQASVEETAARHGVSKAAVYIAKSRVLAALREQGAPWGEELFDD